MPTLELSEDVRAEILEHARAGAPDEVVGVLAGVHDEDVSIARTVYRAANAADAPQTRYEIAPEEELQLLERIEREGEDVVGFYHSHPRGPLEPSEVDAERAAWPGYSYLVAVPPTKLASWRWSGDRFERERLCSPADR